MIHRCTYSHKDPSRRCVECGAGPYVQDSEHLRRFAEAWDKRFEAARHD